MTAGISCNDPKKVSLRFTAIMHCALPMQCFLSRKSCDACMADPWQHIAQQSCQKQSQITHLSTLQCVTWEQRQYQSSVSLCHSRWVYYKAKWQLLNYSNASGLKRRVSAVNKENANKENAHTKASTTDVTHSRDISA